ncbi:unnamed protein product [Macrosiphum euphorbiae]|uniref:Uncharacterized protein n=1 Tax=Macrosiphum euphorbiae TaxID=13131 RepID=A0AAV0W3D0_9HEMI|nr:unnamed protein product [Macrosiphum euphorbiae]
MPNAGNTAVPERNWFLLLAIVIGIIRGVAQLYDQCRVVLAEGNLEDWLQLAQIAIDVAIEIIRGVARFYDQYRTTARMCYWPNN